MIKRVEFNLKKKSPQEKQASNHGEGKPPNILSTLDHHEIKIQSDTDKPSPMTPKATFRNKAKELGVDMEELDQQLQEIMKNAPDGSFTPKKRKIFLYVLSITGNVTLSAELTGISKTCAYEYRKQDPQFAEDWEDAVDSAVEFLEAEARRRAVFGVETPVYQQGELIGHVRKYSDTLLIFLLKGMRPDKYRENIKIDIRANIRKLLGIIAEVCPEKMGEIRDRVECMLDE